MRNSTAPGDGLELDRLRRLGDLFRLGEELEDPLGRGGGLLQDVRDLGELRDRLGERADVLDEGLDVADGDRAADGQPAAEDAHGHVAQVADEVHDRHHHAREELRLPGRAVEHVVVAVELLDAPLLAVERLHHDVPAVHLLDVAVDVAEIVLLLPEVLLRALDHLA